MLDINWIKKEWFDRCVAENSDPAFLDREIAAIGYVPEPNKPLPPDAASFLNALKTKSGVEIVTELIDYQKKHQLSYPLRNGEGLYSKIKYRRRRGIEPTPSSCSILSDEFKKAPIDELLSNLSRPKQESRTAGKGVWVDWAIQHFIHLNDEGEFQKYDGKEPAIYMPDEDRSEKLNNELLKACYVDRSISHRKRSPASKKKIKGVDLVAKCGRMVVSAAEFKSITGEGGGQTEHYNDAFAVTKLRPKSDYAGILIPLAVIDGTFWVEPIDGIRQWQTDGVVHPLHFGDLLKDLDGHARKNS